STRNTRIESLWVEVGTQFARQWRGFFQRLERLHRFDPDDLHHLWLLHHIFLGELNEDCSKFQEEWNNHPISGKGENQSPSDMRLIGELLYDKYADDFENVHPDILQLIKIIRFGDHQIRHEAIEVKQNQFPFESEEAWNTFTETFQEVKNAGIIPEGMGVAEAEWEDGMYGETEEVKVGRKDVEIPLPFTIWWPRAVTWAQGLDIMAKIQAVEHGDIAII
ncbi:hypothetical protein DFH07DRAFT_750030, partial [Mycena maculata]